MYINIFLFLHLRNASHAARFSARLHGPHIQHDHLSHRNSRRRFIGQHHGPSLPQALHAEFTETAVVVHGICLVSLEPNVPLAAAVLLAPS